MAKYFLIIGVMIVFITGSNAADSTKTPAAGSTAPQVPAPVSVQDTALAPTSTPPATQASPATPATVPGSTAGPAAAGTESTAVTEPAAPAIPETMLPAGSLAGQALLLPEEKKPPRDWKYWLTSPAGAAGVSVMVPGTGELLNHQKIGFLFLGLEAALWAGYVFFNYQWQDRKDIYEDWAAAYWDRQTYLDHKDNYQYHEVYDNDSLFFVEPLPAEGTEAYYEAISHPQFYRGWSDCADEYKSSLPDTSVLYLTDKQKSMRNKLESAADSRNYRQYSFTAVVFNHLLSAIDAFRCARAARVAPGLGVQYRFRGVEGQPVPYVCLTYRFQ